MWRSLILSFLAYISYGYVFGAEQDVFVMDGILSDDDLQSILNRLQENDTMWSFYDLAIKRSEFCNDSQACKGAFESSNRWMARLIPSQFTDGEFKPLWTKLKQQVIAKFGVDKVQIHRVGAQISSRGDTVVSSRKCSSGSEGVHGLVVLFIVPKWGKNFYGEMVIYGNDREILKSIHPKTGRAVILPCKYSFVVKPPSMDCKERLHTIIFHISSSNAPSSQIFTREDYNKYKSEKFHLHSLQALKSIPLDYSKLDVAKFITREFITTRGHPIVVFDNLIAQEIINTVADTMAKGIYSDIPPEPNSSDNVPWILGFDVEDVVASPLWHYAQAVVQYASKKDGYYPYDVSCNSIRSHDSTRIHLDCAPNQDEYTLLIYLNPNWTENDHGETAFFDYQRKEMIFVVKPKFGRVAIFQGSIPHSARPPSPKRHGPRFTLAIKFAASKEEAISKLINLDIEPIIEYQTRIGEEEQETINKVLTDIKAGKMTWEEMEQTIQEYERKLKEL